MESYKDTEGFKAYVLDKIFQDALGFAGCELIRRTIGLAHVKDLDGILDEDLRILSKKQALHIGELLLLNRKEISSIQAVIELLEELQK